MAQLFKSRSHKTGLPPGSLVYVGKQRAEAVKITVFDYDEMRCTERQIATFAESVPICSRTI